MMFMKLDLGAIMRKETGLDKPKIVRFLIGNPLIMKEMTKYVPDAGSYAPVTILVDERPDGVHLSYDKWPVFWPLTETRTLSLSLGIWTRKSRTFLKNLQFDDIT
jgi:hypothetical protein